MKLTEELKIAVKELLAANEHSRVGGSVALILKGFDLRRPSGDIDIIVNSLNLKLPKNFVILSEDEKGGRASDPTNTCVMHLPTGHIFDILEAKTWNENFIEVSGFRLDDVSDIVKSKVEYVLKPHLSDKIRAKHISDLLLILPNITEQILLRESRKTTVDEDWDLPF